VQCGLPPLHIHNGKPKNWSDCTHWRWCSFSGVRSVMFSRTLIWQEGKDLRTWGHGDTVRQTDLDIGPGGISISDLTLWTVGTCGGTMIDSDTRLGQRASTTRTVCMYVCMHVWRPWPCRTWPVRLDHDGGRGSPIAMYGIRLRDLN
jgi:hypothetical protein